MFQEFIGANGVKKEFAVFHLSYGRNYATHEDAFEAFLVAFGLLEAYADFVC